MAHVLHALSTALSPVVIAAGVASALTLSGTAVRDVRQRRREAESALKQARAAAYGDLLARSLALAARVQMTREVVRLRTGLDEGLSVLARLRKPLDLFEVYDWLDRDMGPMHDAWSRVWAVGTQEAMDAADRLIDAFADLLQSATAHSYSWRHVMTRLHGVRWTPDEVTAYERALAHFSEERVAFARLMRQELGREAILFTLERVRQEAAERGKPQNTANSGRSSPEEKTIGPAS